MTESRRSRTMKQTRKKYSPAFKAKADLKGEVDPVD
jgi:hypothetical protein